MIKIDHSQTIKLHYWLFTEASLQLIETIPHLDTETVGTNWINVRFQLCWSIGYWLEHFQFIIHMFAIKQQYPDLHHKKLNYSTFDQNHKMNLFFTFRTRLLFNFSSVFFKSILRNSWRHPNYLLSIKALLCTWRPNKNEAVACLLIWKSTLLHLIKKVLSEYWIQSTIGEMWKFVSELYSVWRLKSVLWCNYVIHKYPGRDQSAETSPVPDNCSMVRHCWFCLGHINYNYIIAGYNLLT